MAVCSIQTGSRPIWRRADPSRFEARLCGSEIGLAVDTGKGVGPSYSGGGRAMPTCPANPRSERFLLLIQTGRAAASPLQRAAMFRLCPAPTGKATPAFPTAAPRRAGRQGGPIARVQQDVAVIASSGEGKPAGKRADRSKARRRIEKHWQVCVRSPPIVAVCAPGIEKTGGRLCNHRRFCSCEGIPIAPQQQIA